METSSIRSSYRELARGPARRAPADRPKPSAPGTISVTQLRHARPQGDSGLRRRAAHPAESQLKTGEGGSISPEFADAYTSLAVQHSPAARQEAAGELTRHRDRGPNPLRLSNLAYAQINLAALRNRSGRCALPAWMRATRRAPDSGFDPGRRSAHSRRSDPAPGTGGGEYSRGARDAGKGPGRALVKLRRRSPGPRNTRSNSRRVRSSVPPDASSGGNAW